MTTTQIKERPIIFSAPFIPCKGFESQYGISPEGRVWSVASNRAIKCVVNNCGYQSAVFWSNGSPRRVLIHRLIAEAFVSNPDNKPFVNHIDGNKQNNSLDNLEWVTASENGRHAYANGLNKARRGVPLSKEHRANLSAALKGRKSPRGFAGKKRSPESIKKFKASMEARRLAKGAA